MSPHPSPINSSEWGRGGRPEVAVKLNPELLPMRLAALLSLMLLTPATVFAHEAKVTAEGMSEEFATAEAMREVPKGASVTDTACRSQDVGCRPAIGAPSPTTID